MVVYAGEQIFRQANGTVNKNVFGPILYNVKAFGAKGDGINNDTPNIQMTVNAALGTDIPVYFPDGTYLITENIEHFNDVVIKGPGKIKYGSSVFTVEPQSGDTNTLYVNVSSGADTNMGINSALAFQTIQKAFTTLSNRSELLQGTWRIQLAAGTYTEQAQLPTGTRSKSRIQIIGAVDESNVPTVIFDGGSGTRLYGIQAIDYAFMSVKDIKFQNFTGNNQQGLYVQNFSDLYAINVHASNCGFAGINANEICRLYVEGGVIDACRIGVRVYSGSVATVGYNSNGSLSAGTTITNCTEAGVKYYNQCAGDVNFSTFEGNQVGIQVLDQSRVHPMGCAINDNNVGVRCSIASTWNDDNNTYSGNTVDKETLSFSVELADELKQSAVFPIVDVAQVTLTGSTTETDLKAQYTIPANTFLTVGKKYRVRASGNFTGANTKTVNIRCGVSLVTGFTSVSGSTKSWQIEGELWAVDATHQRTFGKWIEGNSAYNALCVDRTNDMTADRVLKLTGQLADATASIVVETFEIEQML